MTSPMEVRKVPRAYIYTDVTVDEGTERFIFRGDCGCVPSCLFLNDSNKKKFYSSSNIMLKAVLLTVFILFQVTSANEHDDQRLLDSLLAPERYDARVMPNISYKNEPLPVKVNMYIIDVMSVDDLNQDFTVLFYFRQFWTDYRLSYRGISDVPSVRLKEIDKIWKPDIFFVSEKKGRLHDVTLPNAFIRIHPNGSLIYSCRVTLKLTCKMDLRYYPFDTQICGIPLESYGYTDDRLLLLWKEEEAKDTIGIAPQVSEAEFVVTNVISEVSRQVLSTGRYTSLKARLVIRRNTGYFLSRLYVPFVILVILSWISFWLDQNAVALRMGLTLTILAMMCLQTGNINAYAPKVSYTTALDVWTSVCLSFVFASLLEFTLANQLARREFKQWKADQKEEKKGSKEVSMDGGYVSDSKVLLRYLRKYNSPSKRFDVISRFVFPILFIFFNLVYWTIFTSGGSDQNPK